MTHFSEALLNIFEEHDIEVEVSEVDPAIYFFKEISDNPFPYSVSVADYEGDNRTYKELLLNIKNGCQKALDRIEESMIFNAFCVEGPNESDEHAKERVLTFCDERALCKKVYQEIYDIVYSYAYRNRGRRHT